MKSISRIVGIGNAINDKLSQDFDYDDQSRLASMYSATMVASYGYDADGNRIDSMQGGAGNSATSNHVVNTTGANPRSYGYDAPGRITTLSEPFSCAPIAIPTKDAELRTHVDERAKG